MAGLLFPAYQKFYSALNNIEKFNKEKDFFDNISSLDNFFSEYRNVTFVMQKSLAHTQYESIYKQHRDKYLTDRWFVEKRNETIKQHPFKLIKKIDTVIYYPDEGIPIDSQTFTVDKDKSLVEIINLIEGKLNSIHSTEVFFSVNFIFYEAGKEDNIIKRCIEGIQTMSNFLDEMYNSVGEACSLCEEIRSKISNFKFSKSPMDMISTIDYVYYPRENTFERASRVSALIGFNEIGKRDSITNFGKVFNWKEHNPFKIFVFLNTLTQSTELMSTSMIVYKDETYSLDMFDTSIKTTFYRKINEIKEIILNDEVKEVYFMMIYVSILLPSSSFDLNNTTSKERQQYADEEILNCVKIDLDLNEEEYSFIGSQLSDINYVAYQINNGKKNQLNYGKENMKPIIEAFKKVKEKQ